MIIMRRVVITGMGAVTPIGNCVEEFWLGIKEQKTGFGPISRIGASGYKCSLAAEVTNFDAREYMDFKAAKRMELFSQYAVAAASAALKAAGIPWSRRIRSG